MKEVEIHSDYEKEIVRTFTSAVNNLPQSEISLGMFVERQPRIPLRAIQLGIKANYSIITLGGIAIIVTFGHGARHLSGAGPTAQEVEVAIQKKIEEIVSSSSSPPGLFYTRVLVRGTVIEYRANPYGGGYHVGTYYEPKKQP